MKTKGLVFISCLAAGALIASPALGKPEKKSAGASTSKPKRMAQKTTQVTPSYRYHQNGQNMMSSRAGNTRYYAGTRYAGTRSYGGRQYSGTRSYAATPYYGGNTYYGGTGYYYGNGWGYGSSSVWPYVAASVAPYVAASVSAPGYSRYPYSYYGGYPYNYSYYGSGYRYSGSTVAAVQQRLGQLGYYHGVVDGVVGPQTHGAIAAFESRNGLVVDGRISRPLLDTLRLG
jgi:hypothetical protein